MSNYFVYMLLTVNSVKAITYVGYTSNIKKRLALHNESKGAKFTKGKKWKIIYLKKYKSKSQAMKKEFELKKNRIKRNYIKSKFI